jgi:hypothetical protein
VLVAVVAVIVAIMQAITLRRYDRRRAEETRRAGGSAGTPASD